jgi:hypothetical protein
MYMAPGTFSIGVTIKHERSAPATATSTAMVASPSVGGPMIATGQPFAATQFAAQDHTMAQFIDIYPLAQAGDFKALINWGDSAQMDKGTISQPGSRGSPFFVDATHTYKVVGQFTVCVLITDASGFTAMTLSLATVSSKKGGGGAQVPGKRPPDPVLLGVDRLLGMNGAQGWVAQTAGRLANLSSGEEWAAMLAATSTSPESGRPSPRSDDAYWKLLHQRPGDPNDWVAYELALAIGTPVLGRT